MIGLREIDFRVIGSGRTGPVTRTVQQAYHALVRGEHPRSDGWLTPIYGKASASPHGNSSRDGFDLQKTA